MPVRKNRDKIVSYIRKRYRKESDSTIASRFKTNKGYIGQLRRRLGLRVSNNIKQNRRSEAQILRHKKTKHTKDAIIRKYYLTIPEKTLAAKIGRSNTYVKGRLKAMKLKVPRAIIEKRKRDSQIKPGSVPPNKGKKIHEYMSASAIRKSAKTRFKKGHTPINTKFDGAITIRHSHKQRNAPAYAWIRLSKGKWEMLHVWLWKKHNGRIPKGYIVVFKDKNTMNVDIKNLEMITLEENMKRNTIHNMPPELKDIALLIGRLTRKMNKYAKEQN